MPQPPYDLQPFGRFVRLDEAPPDASLAAGAALAAVALAGAALALVALAIITRLS